MVEKKILEELKKPIESSAFSQLKGLKLSKRMEQLSLSIIKSHILLLYHSLRDEGRFKEIILDRSFMNKLVTTIRETVNTI